MRGTTYYQRDREVILNKVKGYYRNSRDELKAKEEINKENYLKKKKV